MQQKQQNKELIPQMNSDPYETVQDENGNLVFKNPDKALLQMQKESLDMLPKEWTELIEIMGNTYRLEDSE